MPGEKELLQEFTSQLKPTVLGQLVEVIFEKMELAGEAGTLLKIEKEIEDAIAGAKAVWQQQNQALSQFPDLAKVAKQRGEIEFDVSDIDDEGFWAQAEQKISNALVEYSTSASAQKQLFAVDAEKGFAFIELCRKRFDVVLMNPPFGEYAVKFKDIAKLKYHSGGHDILTAFVQRASEQLLPCGLLGAITSRTPFFAPSTKAWREKTILSNQICLWADLGEGVLDDAMVETCAYTISKSTPRTSTVFWDDSKRNANLLKGFFNKQDLNRLSIVNQENFSFIPGSPLSYWVRSNLLKVIKTFPKMDDSEIEVKVGLQTGDDFRFIRCWWEVYNSDTLLWMNHAKGGENQPYVSDTHLVVNWDKSGQEIKSTSSCRLNAYTKIEPTEITSQRLTFPYRTHRFSPSIIEPMTVTGVAGMGIYTGDVSPHALQAFLNSGVVNELIKVRLARRDLAPLYQAGTISPIPFPEFSSSESASLELISKSICSELEFYFTFNETTNDNYCFFESILESNLHTSLELNHEWKQRREKVIDLYSKAEMLSCSLYGLIEQEAQNILGDNIDDFDTVIPKLVCADSDFDSLLISSLMGIYFGRWRRPWSVCHTGIAYSHEVGKQIAHALNSYERLPRIGNLIERLNNPNDFFAFHLKQYTKSRRQAPVYWQLQVPSKVLTLWLYYNDLTSQTLLSCVNDFIAPELANVNSELTSLRTQSSRSSSDEKKLDKLVIQKQELEDFQDEFLRLSRFWQPNLNDGVQITAAPLWRLFQHKAWQKKLKQTWEKLEEGDYDWAHLAYTTWPERVLKKCHADRSIAIAHGVESDLWHEVEVLKGKKKEPVWEWQPKPLSPTELNDYVREKIATDERLALYRSNAKNSGVK